MAVMAVLLAMMLARGSAETGEAAGSNKVWPTIQPYSEAFDFRNGQAAAASIAIRDVAGKQLYHLECHTFLFEADPTFDYSGDFECKLTSDAPESVSTLLTSDPDQPRDWWSRGRFLAEELEGRCGDYPEYGRSRSFRLRGMELHLELSNIKLAAAVDDPAERKPRFAAFRFKVTAKPDASATSALAECPKVPPCYKGTPPCSSHQARGWLPNNPLKLAARGRLEGVGWRRSRAAA